MSLSSHVNLKFYNTNLDTADMAYEWNLGQYSTEGTRASGTFTKQLSDDLSLNYVEYLNRLKLKD